MGIRPGRAFGLESAVGGYSRQGAEQSALALSLARAAFALVKAAFPLAGDPFALPEAALELPGDWFVLPGAAFALGGEPFALPETALTLPRDSIGLPREASALRKAGLDPSLARLAGSPGRLGLFNR